jgi:NAD(P) transhydrogenase subunit beta
MREVVINLTYLVASAMFIFGLKGLAHPRTAVRGNMLGAWAMLFAVLVTLIDRRVVSYEIIIAGVVVGALVGAILAVKIQMTAMPQLVALFNGFGGGASVLVAGAALVESGLIEINAPMTQLTVATVASGLIGAVTFWGSLVAYGKLQEVI